MNILILSNPDYEGFIEKIVEPFMDNHTIFIYTDKDDFIFGVENVRIPYEVGISFMYRYKVPAEEVNSHPWFNFHPAPLPEYKGRDLCYHAIMNGEKDFGATIHYMDEDFDTGDIIEVRRFVIPEYWDAQELSEVAINFSKVLFIDYLPDILENTVFPRTPNVGGTYYKKGLINDVIDLGDDCEWLGKEVRAIYYPPHYPRIDIGGVKYKIVREE